MKRKWSWWSPPKQRQRWGETQILPSDNWGQIFFDLFYVGGAYNLGNVIKTSDLDFRCILYFCAAGFPSMMMWFDRLYFDARFTTRPGHDTVHRIMEILQLCCVATALSRIRSVDVMAHPCEHLDVFQFSISLFLNSLLNIARYIEVILYGIGDPGANVVAKRDIMCRIIPSCFLLAAAIESGISYFNHYNKDGNDHCDDVNENPIWFCLASWLSWAILGYCNNVIFAPRQQQIETSVPLNVHFCMHRYGEWFMLMFGESIMSLLIVEGNNESVTHSVKFYSGVLSIVFLAHLHFESEPHHNEDHALTRSRHSHYLYTLLVPVYSMALIAVGVCYKMFLYDYQDDGADQYNKYRMLGGDGGGDYDGESGVESNYYGGSDYMENKQQFTADLFCGSIATVLLCQDALMWLHQGAHAIIAQAGKIPTLWLVLLILSKYTLLFFLIVMSAFNNDPHFIAFFGFGAILFQEILRRTFHASQIHQIETTIKDDGSTDSDTTKQTNATGYTADEDYQYEIQSFADAKLALAKFEQQLIVEVPKYHSSRNIASTNHTPYYAFHTSQIHQVETTIKDDGSTDSDTTKQTNATGYTEGPKYYSSRNIASTNHTYYAC